MFLINFKNNFTARIAVLDIANLHAFAVVADTASFSLAAEQLHLTQPAVSKRISALETELNVRLFDRLGRKVLLTEAGRILLPRARHVLTELEDSRRALRNLSGHVGGTLSLAISHHIGLHRLPPVLRLFTSHYSEVRLDLHFLDSELACEAVLQGEVELGIVTLPPRPQPLLNLLPIWIDDLIVVIQRNHPLAAIPDISPTLLTQYPAIVPGKMTFTRTIIDRAFAPLTLTVAFSTNYLETIKIMVSVGLGWSLLPQSMLDGELAILRLPELKIRRFLGVVQHSGRTLSNAAQAMLNLLDQQIR